MPLSYCFLDFDGERSIKANDKMRVVFIVWKHLIRSVHSVRDYPSTAKKLNFEIDTARHAAAAPMAINLNHHAANYSVDFLR